MIRSPQNADQTRHASRSMLCALLFATASLCGCGRLESRITKEHTWIVDTPPAELVLKFDGEVGNLREEIVKAPVEQLRLRSVAKLGEAMEPGAVVVEYDTDWLDLWLRSNNEQLALIERRLRARELTDAKWVYDLNDNLLARETDRKAKQLEIEESTVRRRSERAILTRSLEQARERLAEARKKLDAITKVELVGGASAAEVRTAMVDYEQALVNINVPEARLKDFDEEDGSDDRLRLEQDLAWLDLLLRNDKQFGSLRNNLARIVLKQERDKYGLTSEHQRLAEGAEEAIQASTDPVYRTEKGGIVAPSDDSGDIPMVAGTPLGARKIVNVISPDDAVIEIRIPESMRNSIRVIRGSELAARVRVPSLGSAWLGGKLVSVSPVKERRSGGESFYRGSVVLDSPLGQLTPALNVNCELQVPMPVSAVVIPSWWATRDFRPVARLANGEKRRLVAKPLGDKLLVTSGLAAGDRILPPEPEKSSRLIFHAALEASDNERIIIEGGRHWEWVIEELVDDGSQVEAGQVICRLRKVRGRKTRKNSAELAQLRADADLQLQRMQANGNLGDTFMNWQEALIKAERKRLYYLRLRTEVDDVSLVRAEAGAELAKISHRQIEAEFKRFSAPVYKELRSENQRMQDRLNMQVGALRHSQSKLTAAATRQARIWDNHQAARQNWRMAVDSAKALEHTYRQARITHRTAITAAEATHVERMRGVEHLQQEASMGEIRSPVSGYLCYNPKCWRTPAVGVPTYTPHLFNIPRGKEREFRIHVPGRLYRDLKVGQKLALYLPAEGAKQYPGRITHIADFFEKRRGGRGGRGSGEKQEEDLDDETTVQIKVAFNVEHESTARPGSTVVVEIER